MSAQGQRPPFRLPPQQAPVQWGDPTMFSQGQGMNPQPPQPEMFSQGLQPLATSPSGQPGLQEGQMPQGKSGLSMEDMKGFAALNQQNPERDLVARQRALSDMMRKGSGDQMKGTQVGRIYKAPNALNLLANIGQQAAAQGYDEAANSNAKRIGVTDANAAQEYFARLTGRTPPPAQPVPALREGGTPTWLSNMFGSGG